MTNSILGQPNFDDFHAAQINNKLRIPDVDVWKSEPDINAVNWAIGTAAGTLCDVKINAPEVTREPKHSSATPTLDASSGTSEGS